jgi:hypothetical protein
VSGYAQTVASMRARRRRAQGAFAALRLETSHYIVLASLAAIISVRFFTEELNVLPRAANFIDIPFLLVVGCAAIIQRSTARDALQQSTIFALSIVFLVFVAVSALVNTGRVDVFPALTFVYGFLSPPAFYLAVYRLWAPGRARAVSQLLVFLAIVQFTTIVFFDLPKFFRTRNPDFITGTFGTNAYQLVFFLLVFVSLVAGIVAYEPHSRVRFFALPFIGAAFLAIFLAQYRSLLATMALTTIYLAALLIRRQRGVAIAAASAAGLLIALVVMIAYVPTNKFTQALDAIRNDPGYFVDSRLGPADDVYHLYGDYWAFPIVGSGPGTYSSRAWDTFAGADSTSDSNVAGPYAKRLMGGEVYKTDVSDKYVIPRLNQVGLFGTRNFSNPYSSYLALLAEVGIVAAICLIALYVLAFVRITRAALLFSRSSVAGDPLPALVLATATAFFLLLQLAIFGNWWETARVTIPTWIMFAIVTRELRARKEFEDFPY